MSTPTQPESRSGGNVFTRKIGPLPMWGWMGIALGLAGVYYMIKSKNSSSQQNNQSAGGVNSPGGVDSSLVPQFINQVYDQSAPPVAPNVTVNKTVTDSNNSGTTTIGNTTTTNVAPPPATKQVVTYTKYTVKAGDTLQSLAQRFGVTVVDIAHAPGNVYVAGEASQSEVGKQLGTGAGLKTGMTLNIPHYQTVTA